MSGPFSRMTLWVVIGVVAASLAAAAVLTFLGKDLGNNEPSAGADSYSSSAIGHRALVQLLQQLDIPVIRSRSDSASKATKGLLVVLEPSASDADASSRLGALINAAPRTLLVLPKWYGRARRGETWISAASLLPAQEIDQVIAATSVQATIARHRAPARWQGAELAIREPQTLVSELDEAYEAVVFDPDGGSVVARLQHGTASHQLWIVADPDVLNNHGLTKPANARFAIELIDRLREGGPVVIDEVVHGYAQAPSLVRTLFEFPLVLATLQVLICALFAVWAAMVRFGPRRAAPPPYAPGKDFLIANTASLLHYGGHHGDALRRYLAQSVAAVRHALHAPALDPGAQTRWLEQIRLARGGTVPLVELERDAIAADTPQRTVEVADRVYRWRMEMTHGARNRS